ncbi:MAG TPA: WhiB family transcriptional regulator [Acidimicrobiales bacterium]|nr:WhiB family transcriptional regulator [Acidimicrobiales bacterium]
MAGSTDVHEPGEPDKDQVGCVSSGGGPGPDPATAWMARALCRGIDPEVFFPHDGVGVEKASRICSGCSVRQPCLDYALANRIDDGVWGGLSERARRRLLAGSPVVSGAGATTSGPASWAGRHSLG